MRFCSLGSGSAGNATLVEAHEGGTTTRLLIDCGLPYKHLDERLAARGLSLAQIDAVFVTHEHSDHVGCARQLATQDGLLVLMSRGTYAAMGAPDLAGQLRLVSDGLTVQVKDIELSPFTVAHDAKEPLQITLTDGNKRFGLLTDLGHVTPYVVAQMGALNALVLECNHDEDLVQKGNYPAFLKQRILGDYGHLSNGQAAALLHSIQHANLRHVVAAHLSEQNNQPKLAQNALASVLNCRRDEIVVADAAYGFDWLEV